MSSQIRVLGDLSLSSVLSFETDYTGFPANPAPRTLVVVQGVPYMYIELTPGSGFFSWQPIGIGATSYVHMQGLASSSWQVQHNLNTTDFGYFVYDDNHKLMIAQCTVVDKNNVTINLTTAMTGTAVLFSVRHISLQTVAVANTIVLGDLSLTSDHGMLAVNGVDVAAANTVAEIMSLVSALSGGSSTSKLNAVTANLSSNVVISGLTLTNDAGKLAVNGVDLVDATTFAALSANVSSMTGVDATQNTNITAAQSTATAAFTQANSAFAAANNVAPQIAPAFTQANAAFTTANAAFTEANSAYTQANTAQSTATGAFVQANSAFGYANNQVSLIAGVDATQNTNITAAQTSATAAYAQANTATTNASAAQATGTAAFTTANSAYTQANTATTNASAAQSTATNAFVQANAAFSKANTGVTNAAAAQTSATAAFAAANNAQSTATAAFTEANAAYTQANTATTNASAAQATATAAFVQANSGFAAANTAQTTATAAFAAANAAGSSVNVTAAFNQANAAFSVANSASSTASAAFAAANAANTLASTGGTITGNLTMTGNILPSHTNTYTIGAPGNKFAAIYATEMFLGANTLYVDNVAVLGSTQQNITFTANTNQGLQLQTYGTGQIILNSNASTIVQTTGQNADVVVQASGQGALARITSGTQVTLTAPTVQVSGNQVVTGDSTIAGNLTISGTTTTVNTTNLNIEDNIIDLNKNENGTGVSQIYSGFQVIRGNAPNVRLVWSETTGSFIAGPTGFESQLAYTPQVNAVAIAANTASPVANASYAQANAAFSQANAAYITANTASTKLAGINANVISALSDFVFQNTQTGATYLDFGTLV